jgi:uncharacterized protein (DUF433 family)
VNGYTYWLVGQAEPRHRRQGPVIQTDLPRLGQSRALSFLELMELRVVLGLRGANLSLQAIRAAAQVARKALSSPHPFATHAVFTDRQRIFASLQPGDGLHELIELDRGRHTQVILGQVLEPFLEDMDFDPASGFAKRWWPLGRHRLVVIDPRVNFGAPGITGTRIRTSTVAAMVGGGSPAETAAAFHLSEGEVASALEFERALKAA